MALVPWDTSDGNADWGKRDQLAGPLSLVQQDSGSTTELQHALELNLARTMALNTDIDEALEKYRALEDAGSCLLTSDSLSKIPFHACCRTLRCDFISVS